MSAQIERQVSSPHLRSIIDYWNALRGERPAPQITEVDPVDIPRSTLPYVILSDLHVQPFRIRYRLVGGHPTQLAAVKTGQFLDQIGLPDWLEQQMTQDYAQAAQMCDLVLGSYPWPKRRGNPATVEYVIMPLLDGDTVTRFLCGEHVADEEHAGFLISEDLHPLPTL